MNMTRCSKGHFYDKDQYKTCPHCANSRDGGVTQPITTPNPPQKPNMVTCPNGHTYNADMYSSCPECKKNQSADNIPTVAKYKKEPVAGWVVAIKGPHKGKDFVIKSGRNFIGRSDMMDICLGLDSSVSRNKHAVLVFEPRSCRFIVQPSESHELVYLNGDVLLESKDLKTGDIISLGNTDLMFVPFCSENFNWENQKDED